MYPFHPHRFPARAAAFALACALLGGCARPAVLQAEPAEDPASSAADSSAGEAAPSYFAIAVKEGSYNPYLDANTLTEQMAGLLFEKLVVLSPSMELEPRLALSVESSGTAVTIRLRGGCSFADGVPVTAEDVAASLLAAKASDLYSARLTNLIDAQAVGDTVLLTLAQPDSLFAYLLDLPVMKAAETAAVQPTASGRYTYGAQAGILVQNSRAPFPGGGPEAIRLTAVSDYDELVSELAMGEVSFYLAEESASSTVATSESYFRTNTLLFLGVNGAAQNPLCSAGEGRALLSALLSRQSLSDRYPGATPAAGALNGLYACAQGSQVLSAEADDSGAAAAMAALGYTWDEETGRYRDAGGQPAHVDILAYSSSADKIYTARLLMQQWDEAGIEVTLTQVDDFSAYLQMIQSRQFELYIGEMKLYNNMDLSPFWTGSARYGLAVSQELLDAYDLLRADSAAAGAFEALFAEQLPYIPLLWRGGVTVSNRRTGGIVSSVSELYYSLEGLSIAG